MKPKRTTQQFIQEAKKVHSNKYDYSLTEYLHKDKRIKIICPEHGLFEQIAHSHIRGFGCRKCSKLGPASKTTKQFVQEAKKVHGNKYDYSLTEYKQNHKKVKIICPKHGIFEQSPHNHLGGFECKQCGHQKTENKIRMSINEFIFKSNLKHNNKYDYSKVVYKNSHSFVTIICPDHGEFKQRPYCHIQENGCPICANYNKKENSPSWDTDTWIKAANKSKTFDSFKLYVIRCFNSEEEFIKIGKTYNTLKKRFCAQLPYNYEVLKVITSESGEYISKLEIRAKKIFKKYSYLPKLKFGGMYECFIIK